MFEIILHFKWVNVIIYFDNNLEMLHPGEPVIITNLLNISDEFNNFSHLISTNETDIFMKQSFCEKRFENEKIVTSFQESMSKDFRRWAKHLKSIGGIGGYHPGCQIFKTINKRNYLECRSQIRSHLKKLLIKESDRMIVRARISNIIVYEDYREIRSFAQSHAFFEVIGNSVIKPENFILSLSGLYSDDIKTAIEETCLLSLNIRDSVPSNLNYNKRCINIELLLNDCILYAQWPLSPEVIMDEPRDELLLFNMCLFRFKEPASDEPDWDGVQIMIQSIQRDQHTNHDISIASTNSSIVNTHDIANL